MKNKFFDCLKGVKAGAWIRLILLAAALVNSFLTAQGKAPFSLPGESGETLALIITAAAALAAYWKNNSFTQAAQVADEVLEQLKREKLQ